MYMCECVRVRAYICVCMDIALDIYYMYPDI